MSQILENTNSKSNNSNKNHPKQQFISTDYTKKPHENLYDSLQNTLFNLKFKYKSIEEITTPGDYNFFGMIYDASLPTEEELPSEDDEIVPIFKYTCEIKIIDQTTNFLVDPKKIFKNMINLTITTDHKDYIPFITKIGEVIRVHHGIYNPKKNKNQKNEDGKKIQLTLTKKTKYKGNWCIFSVMKAIEPYYYSHSRYPYELQDKKIIEYFKEYAPNYIGIENSLVYPGEKLLINRFEKNENGEALVCIIKKVELEECFIFFIMDESDGCELHTHKEFDYLKENEVVRINNFKVINKNVIILSETGNVLILPDYSSARKKLLTKLKLKYKDYFGQEELDNKNESNESNTNENNNNEDNNNNIKENKSNEKNNSNENEIKNNEIKSEEKMDIIN